MTVFQSALFRTTSTVVQTNDLVLVVDPTWLPHEITEIEKYVALVRNERPCYLLFTHGDFDHIIGYGAFPGAITIGSANLQQHPQKEHILQQIREFDANHYITRPYPIEFPRLDIEVHQDEQQLVVGGTKLTFYQAPGHTEDGIMTWVEPAGVWIAGDYLSDFELPFLDHSAMAYETTLLKARHLLDRYDVRLLIPGHGEATIDRREMERRLHRSLDYLLRLRQAVADGDEFTLDRLGREHAFPSSFTEECHSKNVKIIREEIGGLA